MLVTYSLVYTYYIDLEILLWGCKCWTCTTQILHPSFKGFLYHFKISLFWKTPFHQYLIHWIVWRPVKILVKMLEKFIINKVIQGNPTMLMLCTTWKPHTTTQLWKFPKYICFWKESSLVDENDVPSSRVLCM